MIDRNDDRARDARPHHMVVSDGELLDIGPNAETIDEAAAPPDDEEATSPRDEPHRRTAPRFGAAGSGGAELEPGPERP